MDCRITEAARVHFRLALEVRIAGDTLRLSVGHWRETRTYYYRLIIEILFQISCDPVRILLQPHLVDALEYRTNRLCLFSGSAHRSRLQAVSIDPNYLATQLKGDEKRLVLHVERLG